MRLVPLRSVLHRGVATVLSESGWQYFAGVEGGSDRELRKERLAQMTVVSAVI